MFNLSTGRIAALTLIALSLFQFVDAHVVRRESNGERLARGLPPAHPKRFYDPFRHVVRHDASATPTSDIITTTDTSTPTVIVPTSTPTDAPTSVTFDPPSSTLSSTPPPESDPTSVTSDPPSSTPSSTPPPESDTPSSAPPSSTASSATPSSTQPATPNPTATGYITLQKINGPPRNDAYGYMGETGMVPSLPGSGVSGPTAWPFTFVRPDPADSVVELNAVTTSTFPSYRLGGLGASIITMGPGILSWTWLTNVVGHTPSGATAASMQGLPISGYAQTTIFSVDPATNEITIKWVNPDGSTPKTYVAEYGRVLYVTGDFATLSLRLGVPVGAFNPVRLFFTEIAPVSAP